MEGKTMKSKKYALVVLSIFLILLVFVSSASAADANGTDVLSVDKSSSTVNEKLALDYSSDNAVSNDTNVVENDENILSSGTGTFSELQMEIEKGESSGGYITLSKSLYTYDSGKEIRISYKGCTIDGNGAIIDMAGAPSMSVFNVEGSAMKERDSPVHFKNIIIKNLNSRNGAIYVSDSPGSIINCTFENNIGQQCVAIFINSASSYIIENCTFVNNTSISGNAPTISIGRVNSFSINDNCWWGSNNPNFSMLIRGPYAPSGWITLKGTADKQVINPGDKVKLNYAFYKKGNTEVYTDLIRPIQLSTTGGELKDKSGSFTNGEFSTEFSSDTPGTYVITAIVDDQRIYISITVDGPEPKENLTIEATAEPITIGENATVVVTGFMGPDGNLATGNVSVLAGNGSYFAPIVDGVANVVVTGLIETTTANVDYPGDDNFNPANTTVEIIVNPAPGPAKLDLNWQIIYKKEVEPDEYFTIAIAPNGYPEPTGTVTMKIPGQKDDEQKISSYTGFPVRGLKENTTITFVYSGDDNYNPKTDSVNITVKSTTIPTNITVNPTSLDLTVGETGSIIATLNPAGAGGLKIDYDDKIITLETGPDGDWIVTAVAEGNANITFSFPGNGKYAPAENKTVTVTVSDKPGPSKKDLNISVTAEPIIFSKSATIVVTGLENATGNLAIIIGYNQFSVPITGDTTIFHTPNQYDNVTAVISYPGDSNYNNFTTSVDIIVNPRDSNITILANNSTDEKIKRNYVILPSLSTGNVTVILNGETRIINMEDAKIYPMDDKLFMAVEYENLTAGNYTMVAIYSGDIHFYPSNATATFVITKGKNATMNIDVPPVIEEGQMLSFNITLPEDATGGVYIKIDNMLHTGKVINGTATISFGNLTKGDYVAQINYTGDKVYYPLSTTVNVTVLPKSDMIIVADDVVKYYGGPERFVVNVTDSQGTPLANKSVSIVINNVTYNRTTNENGTCSLALNLPANVYNATTTVENTTINSVVTIYTTVNGTDVIKVFGNATQYYATFLDTNGNYLANGSAVQFNINGVMYDRKVSGDKGLAKLNINLEQGEYIITAINLNTTEMSSNNITVIPRIIENNDLTKYYRNATQYTVKIIGDDGKVVGAGVNVTFNINGVMYTRQTNASGIAKLNINLEAGNYIITAECEGCKVSNNITVLPVLTAKDLVKKYGTADQFVATLVDGQGNPYEKQTVQFNVNGVLYNRVTDSSGQAKLNIRLMAGEYIITSSYNGCNIANKITVQS